MAMKADEKVCNLWLNKTLTHRASLLRVPAICSNPNQLLLLHLSCTIREILLLPQAYLVGLTFALAASPCSTPVLATLLAYVASSQDPLLGGGLLLAYTTG